jgi:hypothetical protein
MKIECSWCKKHLGYKCHVCGSRAIENICEDIASCADCSTLLYVNRGAVSSTICSACRAREFPHLPNRLTAEEIVRRADPQGKGGGMWIVTLTNAERSALIDLVIEHMGSAGSTLEFTDVVEGKTTAARDLLNRLDKARWISENPAPKIFEARAGGDKS